MTDNFLVMLLDEVRGKTMRVLRGVTEAQARWAPPGLHNSILWHAGHAYVSHDWMCDPTGTYFAAHQGGDKPVAILGDELRFAAGQQLIAEFPADCHIRLIRNGEVVQEGDGHELVHGLKQPGIYRAEAFLTVDTELRAWIYTNPIYVRE